MVLNSKKVCYLHVKNCRDHILSILLFVWLCHVRNGTQEHDIQEIKLSCLHYNIIIKRLPNLHKLS